MGQTDNCYCILWSGSTFDVLSKINVYESKTWFLFLKLKGFKF